MYVLLRMCVCMYIRMYVYIYIYICMYVPIPMYLYMPLPISEVYILFNRVKDRNCLATDSTILFIGYFEMY
jgi:hypothetical protein